MKRIEKNFIERQQKTYRQLVQNNIDERNNYLQSYRKYLDNQKEISKIKEEKSFKKYENYVSIFFLFIILI